MSAAAYDGGPAPSLEEKIFIMGKEIDRLRKINAIATKALNAIIKIDDGDLVRYCQKADGLACHAMAQIEAAA